jgi:hypothetical protein
MTKAKRSPKNLRARKKVTGRLLEALQEKASLEELMKQAGGARGAIHARVLDPETGQTVVRSTLQDPTERPLVPCRCSLCLGFPVGAEALRAVSRRARARRGARS